MLFWPIQRETSTCSEFSTLAMYKGVCVVSQNSDFNYLSALNYRSHLRKVRGQLFLLVGRLPSTSEPPEEWTRLRLAVGIIDDVVEFIFGLYEQRAT